MKKLICIALVLCLAGLCACEWGTEKEITTRGAETTTIAATEPADLAPVLYTVTRRIHSSLPEFTFTLHGYTDADDSDGDAMETAHVSAVAIRGEGFSQLLDGFETELFVPEWGFDEGMEYGLVLDDFTGDGYLDLRLYMFTTLTAQDGYSLFWLWDAGQKQFVRNDQLEELSIAQYFTREENGPRMWRYLKNWNEELEVPTFDDYYYEYIGGKFVLVESESMWYEEAGDVVYENAETYKLVDGEMKLVSKTREKLEGDGTDAD